MPDNTIYLKDYQPPVFNVKTIKLCIDLYDDHALITSELALKRQYPGPLTLFGDECELVTLQLNGAILDETAYRLEDGNLIIDHCPDESNLLIVTRIRPQDNTTLSGLYRTNHLFCTQCEAEGFRRITFYPDRPDVLSSFTTRITADKSHYPVLLSNGNLVGAGDLEGGRHWVQWQDPFDKPSYLFALVAGDLACVRDQFVTCSGKTVELHIYVEHGNEDKCAHAMESLKKAMRWDEDVYGREYDLAVFMIVAVSDFNMGAMENKGLNIFNSKYILARPDTATDQDFADIESVVAHEYFHNWTGNRVTCRDWFQLSLKEGLTVFRDQEFSRDMNSRDVNRIMDVKVLKNTQFPEDAGMLAHPVRPDSYQEINNFYTATIYNKGAEVIRMQHTLLGNAGFRRGMDLYFERHDGHAVTIDDFVSAMEDANQVDLTQFKRWYSQAGTPTIEVVREFKDGTLSLTLTQSCRPTRECEVKQPFHIPIRIALFDKQGHQLPLTEEVLQLRESQETFHFTDLSEEPLVSLLRGFSAPVDLKMQMTQDALITLLRYENDGFSKWDAAQRLALSCIHGYLGSSSEGWAIPSASLNAYQEVLLNEALDPALRAELLFPPGFEDVVQGFTQVDVDVVEKARDFFKQTLGVFLFVDLHAMVQRLWNVEDHAMNATAYGRRGLKNVCLWLMNKADEKASLALCTQQFETAKTMTDQLASFALLVNVSDESVREDAIERFYAMWSKNELVLDKWFSYQASSERPDTLARVKNLLHHPNFNIKNPNKVRALIGAFVNANPKNFHAIDGSGYAFLTEMLVKLDKINPQIAAKLATPFTRWRRYDETRQALIQKELNQLAGLRLSNDLREITTKSLAG